MMHFLAKRVVGSSELVWSQGIEYEEQPGVNIGIQPLDWFASLESTIISLREVDRTWLKPSSSGGFWIIDLDNLRETFPDLKTKDWLKGQVHVEPIFEDNFGYNSYHFVLTPNMEQLKEDNFKIRPHINERALLGFYNRMVLDTHVALAPFWPVLSGYTCKVGTFRDWVIVIFQHTGNPGRIDVASVSEFTPEILGVDVIDDTNLNSVRKRIDIHYALRTKDAVLILKQGRSINDELLLMLHRHEVAMGLRQMKIFLSHKGADKPMVRRFNKALREFGFSPWLDEEMPAGTNLQRGILQIRGMRTRTRCPLRDHTSITNKGWARTVVIDHVGTSIEMVSSGSPCVLEQTLYEDRSAILFGQEQVDSL